MSTFSIGISGLGAAKKNLDTVGNNIANASTVGFKKSRVEFADVYSRSGISSSSGQPGHGVMVSDISQQFAQGGTTLTQNSLDMSIDGTGFFIVDDNGQRMYTRAGMFGLDPEGYIVNGAGQRLQGFPANVNGDGIEVGAIGDLSIPTANIAPNATTEVHTAFNLDSRELPPTNYIFDPSDSDSYTHLYPSTIYDSLGNSHTLTQYFVKQPTYQPDFGEPVRAVQALLGFARYGHDANAYLDPNSYGATGSEQAQTDPNGAFVGDADGTAGMDADILALLTGAGVNFADNAFQYHYADPDNNPADATTDDQTRGTRLSTIDNTLKNLIQNSSGRAKAFYEEVYDAFTDYLPAIPAGGVDVEVFETAIEEMEKAIDGSYLAYSRLDLAAGRVRKGLFNDDSKMTAGQDLDVNSINLNATQIEALMQDLKNELLARRDGNTSFSPASGNYGGNIYINGAPTHEEAGTYQLAINAIQDIEEDYSDDDKAKETALKILSALESESADNRWHMYAYVDGERVTDANSNTPDYFAFNFTEFGQLEEPLPKINIRDWVPKTADGSHNGSDEPQLFEIFLDSTTQFSGAFGATALRQDGYSTGELAGIDIDEAGIMTARYTNNQSKLVGQVAIANFTNEQGLSPVGGTNWVQTSESGQPTINAPGVSTAGSIRSKSLEDSNVDLSEELVKMILAQRDYQANAKTLQTADTVTQTIINLR